MATELKAWLIDNALTVDDPNDQILELETQGNLTDDNIIDEMMAEITGLKRETLEHAIKLYHRILWKKVNEGYSVQTASFYAVLVLKGVVKDAQWDPEVNSVGISLQPSKEQREEAAKKKVKILGQKASAIQILAIEDIKTGLKDGTASRGKGFTIKGKNIKIAGDDGSVGLYLINSSEEETKIQSYDINHNMPSEINFIVPDDLAEGTYTLRITTQYGNSSQLLKKPRSVEVGIQIQ